jgi:predicted N-formylglutamate amidohydrolase
MGSRPSGNEVVEVLNPDGGGAFLIVCEHASRFIPPEFGGLGLDEAALRSHIAWDPGALAVAERLSALFDAPLVAQRASRLLYDCNRPPESKSAVPAVSEIFSIPGNTGLSAEQHQARVDRFYLPFRNALSTTIEERVGTHRLPVLVTVHSFTPVYEGVEREVELGILHEADSRLADALLDRCSGRGDIVVRRNEPYGAKDGVCHTLIEHGISRGLLHVMLEIRSDLIDDLESQIAMADWLAECLNGALAALTDGSKGHALA